MINRANSNQGCYSYRSRLQSKQHEIFFLGIRKEGASDGPLCKRSAINATTLQDVPFETFRRPRRNICGRTEVPILRSFGTACGACLRNIGENLVGFSLDGTAISRARACGDGFQRSLNHSRAQFKRWDKRIRYSSFHLCPERIEPTTKCLGAFEPDSILCSRWPLCTVKVVHQQGRQFLPNQWLAVEVYHEQLYRMLPRTFCFRELKSVGGSILRPMGSHWN